MCHESDEPTFVTQNGYGDMVIMSMKLNEEKMSMSDVYRKPDPADEQLKEEIKWFGQFENIIKQRWGVP